MVLVWSTHKEFKDNVKDSCSCVSGACDKLLFQKPYITICLFIIGNNSFVSYHDNFLKNFFVYLFVFLFLPNVFVFVAVFCDFFAMKVSKKVVFGIFLCPQLIPGAKKSRNNFFLNIQSRRFILADVSPKNNFCQSFMAMEWWPYTWDWFNT